MIDNDLAILYGIPTKRLKEQVKRNLARFPHDFMFELTKTEKDELVANCDRLGSLKHSSVNPLVLTEQGAAILSSVLRSEKVNALSAKTSFSQRKPIIVMDAGIAIDDNLSMLKGKGYDYLCVSRSSLKKYESDIMAIPVQITDNRKQRTELLKVQVNGDRDQYLWVKSQAKKMKEDSKNGLFSQGFEQGIQNILQGITKKGALKNSTKFTSEL